MSLKLLKELVQTYSTYEWLYFIKILENKNDEEFAKLNLEQIEEYNLKNSNWYSKLLDLSMRLSRYESKDIHSIPNHKDFRKFISLYVNVFDKEYQFKKDLDFSLGMALSRYAYEQLNYYAPPVNDLGRLAELYSSKEKLFKERFGLTPKQIVYFYVLNNAKHDIYAPFDIKNMYRHLLEHDKSLKEKHLKRFLDTFSIDIKAYRMKAKELGISKNSIRSIRLIERYPIVKINDNYFIPSIYILMTALTYKVFEVLNDLANDSQVFKTKFGNTFEEYIRTLTRFSHEEIFYECKDLIYQKSYRKAEFYLSTNDVAIVIEAKLLHIDEDIILHKSVEEIGSKFKESISNALEQIRSSFDAIKIKNKYAIIVIHTHVPMLTSYLEQFENRNGDRYDFLKNVHLLSVIDYEILIHNSIEKIVEYFDNTEKNHITLSFEQQNKYLQKKYLGLLEELIERVESSENE